VKSTFYGKFKLPSTFPADYMFVFGYAIEQIRGTPGRINKNMFYDNINSQIDKYNNLQKDKQEVE